MVVERAVALLAVRVEQAALAAGGSEATIRKWASRGKVSRYGTPGRAEYDLDELIDLAAARSEPGNPD